MQSKRMILAALAAVLLTPRLFAANAYEVRPSTSAGAMASLNGHLYFLGSADGQYGLWTSDGTAATTQFVTALPVGNSGASMTVCADQLFATSGSTLWRSDGTAAGTTQLAGTVGAIACSGRTLYFTDGPHFIAPQWRLWRTDGTQANTLPIVDFTGSITNMTAARGKLFFVALGGLLYVTDGTPAGTRNFDAPPSGPITGIATLGGRAIYSTPTDLRSSDGTVAGTRQLVHEAGLNPPFVSGNRFLYFRDGVWQTDGTAAGTIVRWPLRGSSVRPLFATASGRLFFNGSEVGSSTDALWVSDGTNAGTHPVAPIADLTAFNETAGLLFVNSGSGTSVTAGSTPVSISSLFASRAVAAGSRAFLPMFAQAAIPAESLSTSLYAYDLSFAASTLTPSIVPMSGGTPVTITGTGFDGTTTVTVDGAAVTPASVSATSLTFNAPAHDVSTVDVVVASGSGQQVRLANALTFTCDTLPVAVASGSTTTCALQPVPLSGSGGVACAWLPADGLSDPASCTPAAAPAVTTTYRLIVTNAAGCASTNAADVTVNVKPTPSNMFNVSPSNTFGGNSFATAFETAPGTTYQWTATNAQILSDPTLRDVTFRLGCDKATLGLTVTGSNGCSISRTVNLSPEYSRIFTSLTPSSGPAGTQAVILGKGLACVTGVSLDLKTFITDFQVVDDTKIVVTMPVTTNQRISLRIGGQWVSTPFFFTETVPRKRGDFDGDGNPDIVFRNPATGLDAVWLMNGTTYSSTSNLVSFPQADYHIVGAADFDGDGSNDLLLHNRATGANAIWKMSRMSYVTTFDLPAIPDTNWELEGTGDFNGDGKPDVVFRNQATGANAVWLMNGTAFQSTVDLPALPNGGYRIAGTADFNGDGKADIVWRNASTGANAVWLMNGTAYVSTVNLPPLPNSAYAIGAVADYNGDGKPDIAWRNASTGANALWLLDGTSLIGTVDLPAVAMPQLEMAGPR